MGKLGGLALIAALALAGCAAQTSPEASAPAGPLSGVAPLVAAPIPAQDAPAVASPTLSVADGTALFFKSAKYRWVGQPPADDVLLAAGKLACQQMLSGTDVTAVKVVEPGAGEDQSLAIAVAAQDGLCPETIPKPQP